jgi:hypothetical protein
MSSIAAVGGTYPVGPAGPPAGGSPAPAPAPAPAADPDHDGDTDKAGGVDVRA